MRGSTFLGTVEDGFSFVPLWRQSGSTLVLAILRRTYACRSCGWLRFFFFKKILNLGCFVLVHSYDTICAVAALPGYRSHNSVWRLFENLDTGFLVQAGWWMRVSVQSRQRVRFRTPLVLVFVCFPGRNSHHCWRQMLPLCGKIVPAHL